jgi:hypothetical protein
MNSIPVVVILEITTQLFPTGHKNPIEWNVYELRPDPKVPKDTAGLIIVAPLNIVSVATLI